MRIEKHTNWGVRRMDRELAPSSEGSKKKMQRLRRGAASPQNLTSFPYYALRRRGKWTDSEKRAGE